MGMAVLLLQSGVVYILASFIVSNTALNYLFHDFLAVYVQCDIF